ncbi:MAG: S8 family serine peptidase [Methanomassiliicoccales archaeon]|nr:MAG: S8 family serine peptidase [Methanomassiliicoccales archaeon]
MKKILIVICTCFFLLTSLANIGTSDSGDISEEDEHNPLFINLKADRFDPLVEAPNIPFELTYQDDNNYCIVQCKGPIQPEWIEAILDSGAVILGYVPEYTYILHMGKDSQNVIGNLPFIRWIGPYHPAYKIDQDLLSKQGQIQLNVMVFQENNGHENLNLVKEKITTLDGSIFYEGIDNFVIQAQIDASKIKDIAFIPEVEWIDEYSPPKKLMDNIRVFTGAEDPLYINGFNGTGIVGEVKDDGCDLDHPDLVDQIIATDGSVSEQAHGTSTFGIAFSSGANQERAKGMCYGGKGVFCAWGVGRGASMDHLVNNWGGVFQSNSWSQGSSNGEYSSISQQNDNAMVQFDATMLYAAGNGNSEITQDSAAKNVIAVGGIYHYNDIDRTNDAHSGGGAHGPASDGRIKPDLCGPYDSIYTTDIEGDGGYSSGDYYGSFGGTSGATPVVAGGVGLVYQMYRDNVFGNNPLGTLPHAATVKAILIADAYQYEFSQANRFQQGWGLVDVGNVFEIGEDHFIDDENNALQTGYINSYKITPTTSTPLKISLVWTDVPGTTSSSMHLVNDLNLRVIDPDGVVYIGNFGLNESKWSSSGGEMDHLNNVENIFIENPISGEWTIDVIGENVPMDGVPETAEVEQNYALVASGVTKYVHDLRMHSLDYPVLVDTGENVPISATIMNIGTDNEADVRVWFLVDNITIDTTFVNSIGIGEAIETNFVWMPAEEGSYYISVYVEPLSGETSTEDNRRNEIIDVSAPIGRVLVDDGHGTDWRHHIYYHYIEAMGSKRYRVFHTTQTITNGLLADYDAFITARPTQSYTTEEIMSIENFVTSGGGLLVIGEDDQDILNDLTDYAGISWGSPYYLLFSGDTTGINPHEITENVDTLYFGSHELPLNVEAPAEEIAYTYNGIIYDRLVAAAVEYGLGKVVAIADEECLDSQHINNVDNKIFGENIIKWLINPRPISIIDSPQNGDIYLSTDTIQFEGSSSYDPDGDVITHLWSSNITGEIGNTVYFTSTLAAGQHTITLQVSDSEGKSGVSGISLRVLGPPTTAIQSPSNGSLLSGDVIVSGTALDADGTVSLVEVQVDDDTWQEATDTSSSGDWSTWAYPWNTKDEPDGSHTLSARSFDNDGLNSGVDNIVVTVDNTPPDITAGPIVLSKTEKGATIEWETNEASDSILRYWVEDSKDIQSDSDPSYVTHHSIILTDLSPSTTYHFIIVSSDAAGNSRTIDAEGTFTTKSPTDFTPPEAAITHPKNGDVLKGEVQITADASDDYGISKVKFYINGKLKFTDQTADYSWLWDTTDGRYPDGQYSISIVASDIYDNEATDEIFITLDNEIIPPTIIKKRVTPNSVTNDVSTDVLFTVKVSDPENSVESIEIDLSSIRGSSNQNLYDDGSHGDEIAGDDVYSFEATVPSETSAGEKTITITVFYSEGGTIETTLELYVIFQEGDEAPVEDSSSDEDEQNWFWQFLIVFLISLAVIIGAIVVAIKRRKPESVIEVFPLYQPGYYQGQTIYYQDQTGYYPQGYYKNQAGYYKSGYHKNQTDYIQPQYNR